MTKQELQERQARYYAVAEKMERTPEEQAEYEAIDISAVANELMAIEQAEQAERIRGEQEAERKRREEEPLMLEGER